MFSDKMFPHSNPSLRALFSASTTRLMCGPKSQSLHAALRARTQMLWNAAANDEGGGLNPDINKVSLCTLCVDALT
jgi:hypothetical protein